LELFWQNFELLNMCGVAIGGAVEEKSKDSRVALSSRAALETARIFVQHSTLVEFIHY